VADSDKTSWDQLVSNCRDSTFFHRWGWRDLLCASLGYSDHYLCAVDDQQIVGILPLVGVNSRLFGRSLTSLPFCSYAGPIAIGENPEEVVSCLIAAAVEMGRQTNVSHVELRGLSPMTVDLYAENARAHGTPALGKRFFRDLIRAFPDECDALYVSDDKGRDISVILNFYHHDEVLAYFAGELESARECNANDFKYWSLMKHAAQRGCTRFDFGRSKAGTGSFQFKRLWGFEPHVLHYEFPYLPSGIVPQNNPMNPKYRLAIETWKRLPRAVVDRLGPVLVGGLG
jgi:predicted N-acyltransferase